MAPTNMPQGGMPPQMPQGQPQQGGGGMLGGAPGWLQGIISLLTAPQRVMGQVGQAPPPQQAPASPGISMQDLAAAAQKQADMIKAQKAASVAAAAGPLNVLAAAPKGRKKGK